MRVFITGAAGFIGFHLANFLKKEGNFVLGYDNFNSFYDQLLKQKRAGLLKQTGVDIIKGDIREKKHLVQLLSKYRFTHFVHLAAQAGVRHSLEHASDYVASNLSGFVSVLEALKNFPETKFIYASSSSVYGENKKIPFCPEDTTDHPINLYGASKKAGELIAYAYHSLYHIPTIALRFFTVYGPWGRPDMAYFIFTKNILANKPIRVFNRGKLKRDFTYIDDIIEGVAAAMKLDCEYEIFNLGNRRPEKLTTLIRLLEKNLNKKARLEMLPMQKGETLTTYADISKSKALLNFSPKTSLETGIARFTQWYQSQYL